MNTKKKLPDRDPSFGYLMRADLRAYLIIGFILFTFAACSLAWITTAIVAGRTPVY